MATHSVVVFNVILADRFYLTWPAFSLLFVHDPDADSLPLRLVPEERITFGINPAISTLTTVAQIREDYNEVDCRLIAKEVRSDLN